jgi:outer membrane protein assembly factor BamB
VPGGRDSQGRLPLLVQSVADGSGGLLLLFCDPSLFQNACQLTDLDGQTGSFAWQYTSPHGFNGSFAVRQDGAVIITEYDQVSYDNWLVMFNGITGQRTPLMDLSPLGGGGGATGPPARCRHERKHLRAI